MFEYLKIIVNIMCTHMYSMYKRNMLLHFTWLHHMIFFIIK